MVGSEEPKKDERKRDRVEEMGLRGRHWQQPQVTTQLVFFPIRSVPTPAVRVSASGDARLRTGTGR